MADQPSVDRKPSPDKSRNRSDILIGVLTDDELPQEAKRGYFDLFPYIGAVEPYDCDAAMELDTRKVLDVMREVLGYPRAARLEDELAGAERVHCADLADLLRRVCSPVAPENGNNHGTGRA